MAVLLALDLEAASAQSGQVQVSYDVEFSTTGAQMARGGTCTGGAGFDKLSGTIMGFEPAPAHEDNTYEGILKRDTQLTFCYVATDPNAPDQARNCSVNVHGSAEVWFAFALYADGRGGYLRALLDKPIKVLSSRVTGTCDPAEMAEWQRDYRDMSTGGSPDGQHINLVALPRTGPFPITFPPGRPQSGPAPGARPPGPSTGDLGIWTLKVLGRRP